MKTSALIIFLIHLVLFPVFGQNNQIQEWKHNFKDPPLDSRAMTWWHWMNGNITKTGISKDLEAIKNAGIRGAVLFNVGLLPQGNVHFMGDTWWDYLAFAMQKADSLKLKFGVFNSDGWSMSGGPWITPEESMKKLTWADTTIRGGSSIELQLPQPDFNSIYHDIAVIAFPAVPDEKPWPVQEVIQTVNAENEIAVTDGDASTRTEFYNRDEQKPSLLLDLGQERIIRKVVFENIIADNFLSASAYLEYSLNGKDFQKIDRYIPLNLKAESDVKTFTFSFPEISARFIRVLVDFENSSDLTPTPKHQDFVGIGEIECYQSPGINLWEPKGGQSKRIRHDRQLINQTELSSVTQDKVPDEWLVHSEEMVELSEKITDNGILKWDAPEGKWKILRLGYTSTLRKNAPSTDAGRGFECDKMSASATEKHFHGYVAKVNALSRELLGKSIDFMQMESWEAGIQNWTKGFEKEFEKRNGYSILPWLPVMAGGMVINSYEKSNRFLWDLRKTIAEMMSENYWAVMHRLADENGIEVLGEGSGMQHYLYDPILYHQHSDIPMGEFWSNEGTPRADCKNAASVANTMGKKLVAAEAFTGAGSPGKELWRLTPYDLKKIGDEAFILGVNQFVLHTFVHQPYDVGPGLTLARFGNHFQRHNTWYNHAQGWFDYLARSQFLLRQGETVTDVCYFTGEGIPGYLGLRNELNPPLPDGYDYDGVNLDLLKKMKVVNGELHLRSGQTYKLLAIQGINRMTPELANEIRRLVEQGATVISPKPEKSPSLKNYPNCDELVQKIADEVWGNLDGISKKMNRFGKGKVVWGISPGELLSDMNLPADFSYKSNEPDVKINYIHKKDGNVDVYFLTADNNNPTDVKCTFRIKNKQPEIWNPINGILKKVSFETVENGTSVPVSFDPLGSVFMLFRNETNKEEKTQDIGKKIAEIGITAPWNVKFTSSGFKRQAEFEQLIDWTNYTDNQIKYFSGTAVYFNQFELNGIKNKQFFLDLGEVKNLATVFINGMRITNLWKPPFRTNITNAVKKGENNLEIHITNTAINRLIGDEQFPADAEYKWGGQALEKFPEWINHPEKRNSGRATFITHRLYTKNSELEPSGLLGPVKISVLAKESVN